MSLHRIKITQRIRTTRSIVIEVEAESEDDAFNTEAPSSDDPRWKLIDEEFVDEEAEIVP